MIWFSNQGYLDTTATHRQCNGSIDFIHELPDGKFLLSGVYTTYEGQPAGRILRVHPDGALDTTFNTSIYWGQAVGCHVLADGRVLAAGRFNCHSAPHSIEVVSRWHLTPPLTTYHQCTIPRGFDTLVRPLSHFGQQLRGVRRFFFGG